MMYKKLAVAVSINAVIMYFLTYVMADKLDHVYLNVNRAYMALLMVAPMVIVMLLVMSSMYENSKLNYALIAAFAGLFASASSSRAPRRPSGTGSSSAR